jgi:heme/copper-type cytochrome/quinol oxidase subunit 2
MLSWLLPESLAIYVGRHDGVFHLVYWISGIAFAIAQTGALLAFLRTRSTAVPARGTTVLEAVWAIVPAVILVGLGLLGSGAWSDAHRTPAAAHTKGLRDR